MSQIVEILSNQIVLGESLLQRLDSIPAGTKSTKMSGFISYDKNLTKSLADDADAWETETLVYLRKFYGDDSSTVRTFESNTSVKNHYYDFKKGLHSDLNKNITLLKAQAVTENFQMAEEAQHGDTQTKTPKVFISHSSKDKEFVEALVTLLESIGFDNTILFCSSVEDYWIGLSQNIFESLRSLFREHKLFVIFVHSPRYYESAVSLNEMGAAWVLKNDYCSILTNDMSKEQMKGVVDSSTIFIKVNTPEAPARLNELKKKLAEIFGLPSINDSTWERKRNMFLRVVGSIENPQETSTVPTVVTEEYQRLRIEKMKQEAIERKQALIRGNIFPSGKTGSRILKIYNAGQSVASNVYVEWLNPSHEVLVHWEFGEIGEISPQNGRQYNIALCEGHPETMRLRYKWSDAYMEDNIFEEDVQL